VIDPLSVIGAGSAAIGAITGAGRRRRPDNRKAIAALRSARPTGYLTPEDYTAAERTRGKLSEGVQEQGRLQGYEVSRRARARGLAGSPSEERDQARLNDRVLLGQEHAGEAAQEQLYNTTRDREHFQQESELAIFGAETQAAAREAARQDAQHAMFWNSLNEFIPTIMSALPATPGAPSVGGYSPGTGGYQPGRIPTRQPQALNY
jgi:hypothetical protein